MIKEFLRRLLKRDKRCTPMTNQSLGVFFLYPEVHRDGPMRRPAGLVVADEVNARRAEEIRLWKENYASLNRLYGVAA